MKLTPRIFFEPESRTYITGIIDLISFKSLFSRGKNKNRASNTSNFQTCNFVVYIIMRIYKILDKIDHLKKSQNF